MLLNITESAKEHFKSIITCQVKEVRVKSLNLKIKAIPAIHPDPNQTPAVNVGIELSYCLPGEENPSDIPLDFEDFILYIDKNSKEALLDAVIDYRIDKSENLADHANDGHNIQNKDSYRNYQNNQKKLNQGKLHIKAPFLYKRSNILSDNDTKNSKHSLLFNDINQFIMQEINPWLARHNGMVKLVDIDELPEGVNISLEFGGGCKGCSMVSFTLKRGIEKTLKNKFTQIVLIKDITDHVTGKNPYYL